MIKNKAVVDIQPKNKQVLDVLPKNMAIDPTTEQYYTVVLAAGGWLGMGHYTYTTAGTVQSSKSP